MNAIVLVGVVNVTPDSFSDGGMHDDLDRAVAHADALWQAGADWIEIGGESTRPGSEPVSLAAERARVLPVLKSLLTRGRPLMVDTQKPELAKECLDLGAAGINDVGGLRLAEMEALVVERRPTVCVMHRKGDPKTMQHSPAYDDVCKEVYGELVATGQRLCERGLSSDRIWLDPGIGFGKALNHNIALLANVRKLVERGFPVMMGISRKSFLGKLADEHPEEPNWPARDGLATAFHALLLAEGVQVLRVHDVAKARLAASAAQAWKQARSE